MGKDDLLKSLCWPRNYTPALHFECHFWQPCGVQDHLELLNAYVMWQALLGTFQTVATCMSSIAMK